MKKPPSSIIHHPSSGNVFLFILLGIVLFAALAFTVTRSLQGGSADKLDEREAKLAAIELLDFAAKVERRIQYVLSKGCSENQISFANDVTGPARYINNNAPGDFSCHIFKGTGAVNMLPSLEKYVYYPAGTWQTRYNNNTVNGWVTVNYNYGSYFGAHMEGYQLGTQGKTELTFYMYLLKKEICHEINRMQGLPDTFTDSTVNPGLFTGTYVKTNTHAIYGAETGYSARPNAGKLISCAGDNVLFYTLLVR